MTKRDNENDPFLILALDLKIEILLKLSTKSIARLSFLDALFLDSYAQEDQSSDHQKISIAFHRDDYINAYGISALVRGLICHQNQTKVMIGNPSTGQFITLPRVKTRRRDLFSFLGYDLVNDLYKVLCITVLQRHGYEIVVSDIEHQVFTLGPKQKWRKIACKHLHLPRTITEKICIDGVVYYYAWIKSKGFLICFDITSEDFSVLKLSEEFQCLELVCLDLVNYNGKLALFRQTNTATLNLLVLQDAKKEEWTKVSHLVPSWTDLVRYTRMNFRVHLVLASLYLHSSVAVPFGLSFLSHMIPRKTMPKKL